MKTISRFKPESEFFTEERCYIVEILNSAEDENCSIARARVEPGVTTTLHSVHGAVERYVIIEGQGKVEIGGGEATSVTPFDVVHIPSGVSQRVTNTGQTDLVFLAICTPRFKKDFFSDLES